MPVSRTETCTPFWVGSAATVTWPPSGVNLTAFDNRFNRICLNLRSSPVNEFNSSSTCTCNATRWCAARSRTKVTALSIASGRSNAETKSSMRPASTLDRSKMSLISESRWWPEA